MKTIKFLKNKSESTITATDQEIEGIRYIRRREGIRSDRKFVEIVYKKVKRAENISMAVRDYVIKKLMDYNLDIHFRLVCLLRCIRRPLSITMLLR